MSFRQEKLNTLFKKLVAHYIGETIEGGIVSVVDCVVSEDGAYAKVFLSVYPETKRRELISILAREKKSLHDFLKKRTRMKYVPNITFEILGTGTRT